MLKHSSRRASRGVTLIEISVTLVILGLLVFATAPTISAWMRNTQVRNTASSLLSGLAQARNEAIRRNTPMRFNLVSLTNPAQMNDSCALSSAGVSWVVSVRDPAGKCGQAPSADPAADAADANNPLIVEANAGGQGGSNVVVAARRADGTAADPTIVFNGFGRVADAAPMRVIDVHDQASGNDFRRLRVEVTTGGAARLCDMTVTDNTDPRVCATRVSIP
jgi:type IV fimbrial biogenesis protein FimT